MYHPIHPRVAQILLDILELADIIGSRAIHFCVDHRKHPTQSLLSPALASFQGPALLVFMPGVQLSVEQICKLHRVTSDGSAQPAKEGDRESRFGLRLMAMYSLAELPTLLSGGQMCAATQG